ncbi:MAG: DUF1559 domain-containing protein [Planctomycetes bacterium]|nr:DUF1559 domain-containing protein [Planctomycetota bacterium]
MIARPRPRTGFTLVEMLVVITIIGTLMAMLLPAIQAARETARAMTCRANMENLSAAVDIYEQQFKQYPGYQNAVGSVGPYPGFAGTNPNGSDLATPGRKASWVVTLLPYLDQSATFDKWTSLPFDPNASGFEPLPVVYMEVLNCPSDTSMAEGNNPALSYVGNAGWGQTISLAGAANRSESIHDGIFLDRFDDLHHNFDNRKPNLGKDGVADGMNYTLLFSENLHEARNVQNPMYNTWVAIGAPHDDDTLDVFQPPVANNLGKPANKRYTVFVWFSQETAVNKINGAKYQAIVDNSTHEAARPASFHTGGVNAIFAGGNSQFLRETIDYRVFQQLCTTNDKKSNIPGRANLQPLSDSSFQ